MKKLILFVAAGAFAFTSCNKAPEVSMTADKSTAKVGEVISFENTTEKGFNYVWDFGDGSSSEAFAPTHVYAEEGDYTVTLSGSDKKGRNFGTATQAITIEGFADEEEQLGDDYDEATNELTKEETEFMLSLIGTYTISDATYEEEGTKDCNDEDVYESNDETEDYSFELLSDGSMLITDHLGNVTSGWWEVKKGNLLRLENVGSVDCDLTPGGGGSSFETSYSFFNGGFGSALWFTAELSGSTLSLSHTYYDETTDNNGDPCTVDEITTVSMKKS